MRVQLRDNAAPAQWPDLTADFFSNNQRPRSRQLLVQDPNSLNFSLIDRAPIVLGTKSVKFRDTKVGQSRTNFVNRATSFCGEAPVLAEFVGFLSVKPTDSNPMCAKAGHQPRIDESIAD